jgi:hypothetical protein
LSVEDAGLAAAGAGDAGVLDEVDVFELSDDLVPLELSLPDAADFGLALP